MTSGRSKIKNITGSSYSKTGDRTPAPKVSERLETAYASLKDRYHGINIELEAKSDELLKTVKELDFVTHYLNRLIANISQGIIYIDADGKVITYNKSAENILNTPAEGVLFQPFWKNFGDEFLGFSMKLALEKKQSQIPAFIKLELENQGTKELEIETTFVAGSMVEVSEGAENEVPDFQGLIVLVRDITELRRLELIAQRKNRMNELGEMASMVAHEIRNPLGGIKGFASLLQRDLSDKPELQKMASYIIQGTENLNDLVTSVLNFSRPLQMLFKSIDLRGLLKELREHVLNDERCSENIEIRVECGEEEVMAPIDVQSIRASLLNLMINSIQAMPEGGTLTLKLAKEEDCVVVQVVDTGIGISPENLKKIFTPFFTTRPDGNGFGLPEVHKIVQAHDGMIEVKSEVKKGTTFIIRLPLKRMG